MSTETWADLNRFKEEAGVDGCWVCLATIEEAKKKGSPVPRARKRVLLGTTEKKSLEVRVCPRCDVNPGGKKDAPK